MTDLVEEKLNLAAEQGIVSKVASLLADSSNLNINWGNQNQWTALHTASYRGHVEVAKLFLADPHICVNQRNRDGQTPFSLACTNGRVPVVELLLKDPRVDITLNDNSGRTPLWWTSYHGYLEVIEWFIASDRDMEDVMNKKGNWRNGNPLKLQEGEMTEAVSVFERFITYLMQTRQQIKQLSFKGNVAF